MTLQLHILSGCSPAPLANYLKALGILRLVSEQADQQARGWWDGEQFCLLSTLDRRELESFFLERYEPTPLLSPWNKGCGFFKAKDPGLTPLEKSTSARFLRFRTGSEEARKLVSAIADADAAIRAIKARTKTTAKGFQSDDQRRLLERSPVVRACLDQLEAQLSSPELSADERADINRQAMTVKSLLEPAERPPGRVQAEALKASNGYKRVLAAAERHFKSLKAVLIPECRLRWRGPHLEWLSAAVVLDEMGNPEWPSLLGTGGNDGNLDFTNNFMQQLVGLFDTHSEDGKPVGTFTESLSNALWLLPAKNLTSSAVGQYQPGSAGGANSSTGFVGGSLVNPWDFVLMMEGSLLFTACATRRLDPTAFSRASAPFAVRSLAAGFATPGSEKAQRGEQWMPLWTQPATLAEVRAMFGEARLQLGRQTANRPVDVARAISRLGVARGIGSFVRYGYLERNGQATLAVPLGRICVPRQQDPRSHLIDDLAGWLDRVERCSRDRNAPASLAQAERRLADAILGALTHDHTPDRWQAILLAAVEIEGLQASGTGFEAGPMPALRRNWVSAVDDGSAEVRLALALGSAAADYSRQGRPIDSVRHHVLPLEPGGRRFKTAEKRLVNDTRVVVAGRDPIRDLGAIVERRLVESRDSGQRRSRLIAAPGCGARLDDLAHFIEGTVDLRQLLGLARAFMAIKWDGPFTEHPPLSSGTNEFPDDGWLAVRLSCLPWPLSGELAIPADPRLVRLLISGDAGRAIEVACRRLGSAGIRPPMQAGVADATLARRWAAALAFPINHQTALKCLNRLDPSKGTQHA